MTNPSETAMKLRDLCRPEAEAMPDGMRLTALIHAANEAADTIDRLTSSGEAGVTAEIMGTIIPYLAPAVSISEVREKLAAVLASPREGHVEVPVEPTDAMIEAGLDSLRDNTGILCIDRDPLFVWRAMVRAANQGETK